MKAIVAGGGIGGLTVAIALRKAGIEAEVYERAPEFREAGAGIGLAANALSVLDLLGLGEVIRSGGFTAKQGGIRRPDGAILAEIPSGESMEGIGAIGVMHRAELLAALSREVDPNRLHLDSMCVGFDQDRDGVTAMFHNGEVVRGDVLIGADGLMSRIRTQLFGIAQPLYAGYTAWRAVVEFDIGDCALGETWGRGCRFGIVPMSRGRVYWFATNNEPEGQRDPGGRTKQTLLDRFQGWHDPVGALIGAAPEESILRNGIYDMNPLPQWGRGRVVLLGDAAHPMTPNLGQGGCQAIEDAIVLAVCLKKNAGIDAALAEYQARRMPRVKAIVMRSRWLGAIAQLENPVLRGARNLALRTAPKGPSLKQMKALLGFDVLTASEKLFFAPPPTP